MSLFVGIDVGGTAIKHGVVTVAGDVLEDASLPTPRGGRDAILTALDLLVKAHGERHDIAGIGVGTAGAVDYATGTVRGHSPNIAGWEDTPVAAELSRRTSLPVTVDNDANCMALAETRAGAGRGSSFVFFLTLGTGVGSAVVYRGKLMRGAHSMGGEWGHATIVHEGRPCACGQRGHLEAYASATALTQRMLALVAEGVPSLYAKEAAGAELPGSREVFAAAAEGDKAAGRAIAETTAYLGTGIASAVNLLDPELVVIGGGMAAAGETFFAALRREVQARVHAGAADYVRIVPAALGNRAGLIGAALLCAERAQEQTA
jgi:glucokinase